MDEDSGSGSINKVDDSKFKCPDREKCEVKKCCRQCFFFNIEDSNRCGNEKAVGYGSLVFPCSDCREFESS